MLSITQQQNMTIFVFHALLFLERPVRSELTFHHCEAKEVELFDAEQLRHTIENILPRGLWLERVESTSRSLVSPG